jgi:hypothetical protein
MLCAGAASSMERLWGLWTIEREVGILRMEGSG